MDLQLHMTNVPAHLLCGGVHLHNYMLDLLWQDGGKIGSCKLRKLLKSWVTYMVERQHLVDHYLDTG